MVCKLETSRHHLKCKFIFLSQVDTLIANATIEEQVLVIFGGHQDTYNGDIRAACVR